MKLTIISIVLTIISLSVCEDKYTDRYDDINVDEILQNKRLLTPYIKCVLDQGRCAPEGKELKVHIKDAMQTGCQKCTPKQRISARKVVNYMKEHEPEKYEDVKKKYDPEDKYKSIYEPFLEADD